MKCKIGDVCSLFCGIKNDVDNKSKNLDGILFLTQENIKDGIITFNQKKRINISRLSFPDKYLLKCNDVLINLKGQGTVGRCAQLIAVSEKAIASNAICIARPHADMVHPHFFGYALRACEKIFSDMATGSTYNVILTKQAIFDTCIPLPPMERQAEIVSLIQNMQHLIDVSTAMVDELNDIRQCILECC